MSHWFFCVFLFSFCLCYLVTKCGVQNTGGRRVIVSRWHTIRLDFHFSVICVCIDIRIRVSDEASVSVGCTEWVKSDNMLFLVNSWIRKLGSIGMRWWWWVHHIPLGGMTVASVDTSCPRTARVCPFHIRPHKEKTIFQSNDYFVYMLLWWVVRLLFACILVGVRQQLGPN